MLSSGTRTSYLVAIAFAACAHTPPPPPPPPRPTFQVKPDPAVLAWKFERAEPLVGGPAALSDGSIVVTTATRLWRVGADGKPMWNVPLTGPREYAGHQIATTAKTILFWNAGVAAAYLPDGTQAWSFVPPEKTVVAAAAHANLSAIATPTRTVLIDVKGVGRLEIKDSGAPLLTADMLILTPDEDFPRSNVIAYSLGRGRKKWRTDVPQQSRVLESDAQYVFMANEGEYFKIDLRNGRKSNAGPPRATSWSYDTQRDLYIVDGKREVPLPGAPTGEPIGCGKNICIALDDGTVRAYTKDARPAWIWRSGNWQTELPSESIISTARALLAREPPFGPETTPGFDLLRAVGDRINEPPAAQAQLVLARSLARLLVRLEGLTEQSARQAFDRLRESFVLPSAPSPDDLHSAVWREAALAESLAKTDEVHREARALSLFSEGLAYRGTTPMETWLARAQALSSFGNEFPDDRLAPEAQWRFVELVGDLLLAASSGTDEERSDPMRFIAHVLLDHELDVARGLRAGLTVLNRSLPFAEVSPEARNLVGDPVEFSLAVARSRFTTHVRSVVERWPYTLEPIGIWQRYASLLPAPPRSPSLQPTLNTLDEMLAGCRPPLRQPFAFWQGVGSLLTDESAAPLLAERYLRWRNQRLQDWL